MENIRENINNILKTIRIAAEKAGRSPDDVKLVAVSKGVGIERIKEAVIAGQKILGESFYQEARDKIEALLIEKYEINWHFIGHLQTNKAKYIAKYFDYLHTLDSLELALELNRHLEKKGKALSVLIQVNIGKEGQKHGILPENAKDFLCEIKKFPYLDIKGLMTIHPLSDNPIDSIRWFKGLRELRDKLELETNIKLNELSMGMSDDFEEAVMEGATFVRTGAQIFGERIKNKEKIKEK